MTSDAREKSWEDGAPVEYYDFIKGDVHFRYNTSDRVLSMLGEDWLPMAITRGNIQEGAERNKLTLTVEVPRSAEVFGWWHPYPVSASVGLTVYTGHLGESDQAVTWIGRVMSPKFTPRSVRLTAEPSTTLSKKTGQVQCWQRGCMHVLYKQGDGLCNVVKEDFAVPATLTFSVANILKATEFASVPSRRLAGGYIEWEAPDGTLERRSVNTHNGDTINVMYGASTLPVGTEVVAIPGCRHTYEDCDEFFDNGPNYGGDLYGPERSPFNGNPVF